MGLRACRGAVKIMGERKGAKLGLFLAVLLGLSPPAFGENLPPQNLFFADSPWPKMHGGSGNNKISIVAGPTEPSRPLRPDEITWKKLGPFEAPSAGYSTPYPNGRRTIVLGMLQSIVKLDAETLETISTYAVRPGHFYSDDQIGRLVNGLDKLNAAGDRQPLYDEMAKHVVPVLSDEYTANLYGLLTRKNERLFFSYDKRSGKRYLQFYGDKNEGDFYSPLVLKREWQIPDIEGHPFAPLAANLTYDGWIVVVSNTGTVLVTSDDFEAHYTMVLAPAAQGSSDLMQSYVRNGIAVDDKGGIYVVTKDFLARVQWTGKGLTMDEARGAWKVPYPSGARGSGTTPVLMGWGDGEDHLIAVADGLNDNPHMMVFWRDAIPNDWKGLPGYDRRVAGVTDVSFVEGVKASTHIENSPVVKGYGIFSTAESPSQPVGDQGSVLKQFVAEGLSASLTGTEAVGGVKWEWNPQSRKLQLAWRTPLKLALSICTPSVNDLMYCVGRRDGKFTLEGLNWKTGASAVHYNLGSSLRYFAYNPLVVAPNGAVDLLGVMGLVRMAPHRSMKD